MSTTDYIKFGDNLDVTDEGGGVIRVDAVGGVGPAGPAGADGAVPSMKLLASWGGSTPTLTGSGLVWRVPYSDTGSSLSFTIKRVFARIETSQASTISFRIEKSPASAAFSATTVTTVNISAGNYESENTGLTVAASSGDLLRLYYAAVGTVPITFQVELVGST